MTKSELRQIFLERRTALSPAERQEKSRRIATLFFDNTDLSNSKLLHGFIPLEHRSEVDTSIIIHEVWSRSPHIRVAVPRVDLETGEMESVAYEAETELVENAWRVREPVHGTLVDPSEVDIVLVPLLCFDELGFRVGYGKGFYDRFLKNCRPDCRKIGLSFFPPVDKIDDTHDGDVPLDLCFTPDAVYRRDDAMSRMIAER